MKPVPEEDEDDDVKAERERVDKSLNGSSSDDILLVHDLVKKYDKALPD